MFTCDNLDGFGNRLSLCLSFAQETIVARRVRFLIFGACKIAAICLACDQ